MIKVSVIIPVYNVEKYLEKCIQSVINQSLKDIEIILVDDGSGDLSGKICDDFAKCDSRVKVIHQKNQGPSAARNKGIEISKGEYISFVDSDDYLDEKMLEVLYNKGKEHNIDIVFCDLIRDKFGNAKIKEFDLPKDEIIDRNGVLKFIKSYKNVFSVNHIYAKIHKRDLLINNNIVFPENLKLQEDTVFVLESMIHAESLYCIKGSYYNHIKRADSLTTKKYRKDIHFYYNRAYLTVLDLYRKNHIEWTEKEITDRTVLQLIICMFNINNSPLSVKEKETVYRELGSLLMTENIFKNVKISDFPADNYFLSGKKVSFAKGIIQNCKKYYFLYKINLLKNKKYTLLAKLK